MPPAVPDRPGFSQRHPFLFGLMLILAAMVMFFGAMAAFLALTSDEPFLGSRETIGVVNVDGMIVDPVKTTDWIRKLTKDDTVKGVILRINSPGGVVGPSQEIYQAVLDLRAKKPVVASMGAVAASGGYYIAAAANRIVANPGTLTGSIGVRLELSNLQELMGKLGIKHDMLASGPYKGAGSPFTQLTPEQRQQLQSMVMDLHTQFVDDVAKAREMDKARVQAAADGRAFTGRQALELGLVDQLGGYDKALTSLRQMANLREEVSVIKGPKEDKGFLLELLTKAAADLRQTATEEAGPRWQLLY